MTKALKVGQSVTISKETWDWAKSKPEYSSLIEDIEDLEAIRMAKEESKDRVPFDDVIAEYEKTHNVKIRR